MVTLGVGVGVGVGVDVGIDVSMDVGIDVGVDVGVGPRAARLSGRGGASGDGRATVGPAPGVWSGGKARGSPPEGFAERLSWSQSVPVTARRDIDVLRTRPGGVGGAGDEPTGCQA